MANKSKTVGMVLLIIFSVLSVGIVAFFSIDNISSVENPNIPQIYATLSNNEIYYGGIDSVDAVLKYDDGYIEKGDFRYSSYIDSDSDRSVIEFTTETSGNFRVVDKDYLGDVTIVIKSIKEEVKNIELRLKVVAPPDHKIYFDYNGATSDIGVLSMPVRAGESIDFTEMPIPRKDNYTFEGWYFKLADNTIDVIHEFDPKDVYYWDYDIRLFARFSALLILDDDMGSSFVAANNGNELKVYYNENLPSELQKISDKNGWNFNDWYSGKGGKGKLYRGTSDVFTEDKPILYAKWTADIHVDTVFESDLNSDFLNVTYDDFLDLPLPIYNNNGIFVNWAISTESGEIEITNNDLFLFDGNSVLNAKVKFPVIFDFQDASSPKNLMNYYVLYNGSINDVMKNVSLPTPISDTENGWFFEAWNTNIGGTGIDFNTETVYSNEGALILYAKRSGVVRLYTEIGYDGNPVSSYKRINVFYNSALTIPNEQSYNKWQFNGYFTDRGGRGTEVKSIENYKGYGNRDLYAKWTADIAYVPQLGETGGTINVTYNAPIHINAINIPNYKNSGYSNALFLGWHFTEDGSDDPITESTVFNKSCDSVIYAKIQYDLTVDYNDATDKNGGENVYRVIYNSKLSDYISDIKPLKKGWKFDAFYSVDDKRISVPDDLCSFSKIVAGWIVEFNLWDDYMGEDIGVSSSLRYGKDSMITVTLAQKGSWKHKGWYLKPYGNDDYQITDADSYQNYVDNYSEGDIEGPVKLYARRVAENINIEFVEDAPLLNYTSVDLIYGQSIIEEKPEAFDYSKSGYVAEWYLDENFEVALDKRNTAYSENVTGIYGRWEPMKIKIFFGDGEQYYDWSTEVKYSDTLTTNGVDIPENKEGYKFIGYYDGVNDDSVQYYIYSEENGLTINPEHPNLDPKYDKDVTLYAHWLKLIKVTLKHYSEQDSDSFIYLDQGQSLPQTYSVIPEKIGYEIIGYYDCPQGDDGGTVYYSYDKDANIFNVEFYDGITDDLILYSHWLRKTRIYFESDDGETPYKDVFVGELLSAEGLEIPQMDGYAFKGYYDKAQGQADATCYYYIENGELKCDKSWDKDVETAYLFAHWSRDVKVFWVDGSNNTLTDIQIYHAGDNIKYPLEDNTFEGQDGHKYRIIGWKVDSKEIGVYESYTIPDNNNLTMVLFKAITEIIDG
ncbi:MAG: InlB B-repeat-containing protein [Clostridia bacterium]|nr:InlB B-repeat-containing protein [Clostridia bacterium]